MPNWCSNTMDVNGKGKDIKQFVKDNYDIIEDYDGKEKYSLSLERLAPTPLDTYGEITEDWYKWRINNWGTKWDVCEYYSTLSASDIEGNPELHAITVEDINNIPDNSEENARVFSTFDTAWSPPIKAYDIMRTKYGKTSLVFDTRYYEPGCQFAGQYNFAGGVVLDDDVYVTGSFKEDINYYRFVIDNGFESSESLTEWIEEWTEGEPVDKEEVDMCIKMLNECESSRDFAASYMFANDYLRDRISEGTLKKKLDAEHVRTVIDRELSDGELEDSIMKVLNCND